MTVVRTNQTIEPVAHPREQRQAGDRLADPDGERIHEGAGEAGPGADQGDRAADHLVVAEPPASSTRPGRNGSVSSAMPIVPPPIANSSISAGRMTSPRPRAAATTPAIRASSAPVACRTPNAPADDEDVEDDRRGRREAARPGEEDVAERRRPGRDRPVGVRIDELPPPDLGARDTRPPAGGAWRSPPAPTSAKSRTKVCGTLSFTSPLRRRRRAPGGRRSGRLRRSRRPAPTRAGSARARSRRDRG